MIYQSAKPYHASQLCKTSLASNSMMSERILSMVIASGTFLDRHVKWLLQPTVYLTCEYHLNRDGVGKDFPSIGRL